MYLKRLLIRKISVASLNKKVQILFIAYQINYNLANEYIYKSIGMAS